MMLSTTIERLDFFLVAFIFVGQSLGNEYMMTCSRPVVSKSPRLLKLDLGLPCDLSVQSWCNLPGDKYPWHAVRSFVFENQGLMRRMYGEVRQLSVLRMEFNGNSIDENNSMGREFDEIFKPVSTTTTGAPTTTTTTTETTATATSPSSSTTTTTSSSSSSPTPSSAHPPLVTRFTTTTTTTESGMSSNGFKKPSSGEPAQVNLKSNNFVEEAIILSDGDGDKLSTTRSSSSAPVTPNLNGNVLGEDVVVTGGSGGNTAEPFIKFAEDGYLSDQATPSTTEGQTEGTTLYRVNDDESDVFTTESIQHILFQDAERTTTTTTTTVINNNNSNKIRTTTEDGSEASASASTADAPQQIHRSDIKGVNACPVKEEVVAPYWANNTRGEVLALLNLYPFEQYIHWEKCTFEHRQMYCREGCRCEQQYRLHRLLAFDPTNECRGIFSDWFRFPSCCVCKCYLTSSDLAQERFSFNRSPRLDDSDIPDVNGVDDSHFYYKSTGFNARQPR